MFPSRLFLLGSACRSKVTKKLSAQYRSVDEAEEKLGIDYFGNDKLLNPNDSSLPKSHSSLIHASPVRNPIPKKILPGNFLKAMKKVPHPGQLAQTKVFP